MSGARNNGQQSKLQAPPHRRVIRKNTLRRIRVAYLRTQSKNNATSMPPLKLPQHLSNANNENTVPGTMIRKRKCRRSRKANANVSMNSPLQQIQNNECTEMEQNEFVNYGDVDGDDDDDDDDNRNRCADRSEAISTDHEEMLSIDEDLDCDHVLANANDGIVPIDNSNSDNSSRCTDDYDVTEDNDSSTWEQSSNDEDPSDDPTGMFSIKGSGTGLPRTATMRPNISETQILSQIIALSMRHNLSYEATVDMFKVIISTTNSSGLPSTKKRLWAALLRNDELVMVRHLYCRYCHDSIGQGTIPDRECICKASGPKKPMKSLSYFIQLNLEQQLKILFSIPEMVHSLRYRYTRKKKNVDGIEDIYDGKEYRKECGPNGFLSSEYNYSFTVNTDGAAVSNSSNFSAWPILFSINELPPHARKRHILMAGIWVDNAHPDLNALFFPVVKELRSLYETGVTWKPNNTDEITSKFIVLIATVDSIARPAFLNMTQFNGEFGCTFCYANGIVNGHTRTYPIETNAHSRTDNEIREHMRQANETKKKVFGVKGTSIMSVMPKFDMARGTVVESMHNLFLGVVKQHTLLLLFGKATDPWYKGNPKFLAKINSQLQKIRSPSRVSRKPRQIQTCRNWKASEWRNWLLYYCTLCLQGIIRECDMEHLTLLSRAAYMLNKDSISTEDLQETRLLLEKYIQKFEEIFKMPNMTFNVHLLNHLVETVENWGPLWAHSAFPFESFNKRIIDSVTSATARPLQIVTRFLMNRFVESLIYDETTPQTTRNLVHSILNSGKKGSRIKLANVPRICTEFQGLGSSFDRPPSAWQSRILHGTEYRPESMSIFKRAMIKGIHYSCREAESKNTNTCNKFVFVKNGGFSEILNIVRFRHNGGTVCGLFIKCFDDVGNAFQAQHIKKIVSTARRAFIASHDVEGPVIMIFKPYDNYGVRLANVWETD